MVYCEPAPVTAVSGYNKFISNRVLYNAVNADRFDIFFIDSIRKHYERTSMLNDVSHLHHSMYPNDLYFKATLNSGLIPPEAFLFLDRENYIQDRNGVPIIYHIVRRPTDKRITHSAAGLQTGLLRFDRSLPANATNNASRSLWWHRSNEASEA